LERARSPGLGTEYLANAIASAEVTKYANSKKEADWPLTAGCQLFRDLHKARGLQSKIAAATQPAAGKPPAPSQASADKAAQEAKDAKDALDAILKQYKATKLSELEAQSKSAVCVLYVEGREKQDSRMTGTTWCTGRASKLINRASQLSAPLDPTKASTFHASRPAGPTRKNTHGWY
jgi:hypothetical protein